MLRAFLAAFRPPPKLTVSQWADLERRLSPESSAEPGRWRTSRAEYQRGFMDAASDPHIDELIGIMGSQVGKTDCVNNILGFHIHHDPAPILIVQPTLEMAETWSKDRLAPMVRDTPSLRGRLQAVKAKSSGQTIRHKTFPGGHLTAAGSNSPASLASRPIRVLLCDEIDRYKPSAGAEGNPLKLASTRTNAFWNRKRIYITSPGNKGSSIAEPIWERSDQRRYFVPCHACHGYQYLKWAQVSWEKDESGEPLPQTACYVCEHCGSTWNDAQRWAAVRKGEWRATAPFRGCAGFHVPALLAPWQALRLEVIVTQWLEAQGHPELLRVFVNTILAELWEEKYHALNESEIERRREPYPVRGDAICAPIGVAVITCGVDVQDDRLEAQIQGYGRGFEQWKLAYWVLPGDPSGPLVWEELWQLLQRPIPMARGGVDFIRATCVDSGAHALKVYDFCRPRFRYSTADGRLAYVFAVKGVSGQGGEFWPRQPSRNNKGRIPLYLIRVDHAKELLYAALQKVVEPGPGYIHIPQEGVGPAGARGAPFDHSYARQLTAEKVSDRTSANGAVERVWELKSAGRRNEALDTSNYGEAALRGLLSMGLDIDVECQRATRIALESGTEAPLPAPLEPANPPAPAPKPRRRRRRSRSRYLDGE